MSQELTQWIAEVRTLQRQLADTRKESRPGLQQCRQLATALRNRGPAATGGKLQISDPRCRLCKLSCSRLKERGNAVGEELRHNLEAADSSGGMQAQLQALVARCQELTDQLEAEKEAHARTLQSLTAALGDAFDTLTPETSLALRKN